MTGDTSELGEEQRALLEHFQTIRDDPDPEMETEPDKHDLAEEFDVTPDTIKYHIEQLRNAGFHIDYVQLGPRDGYYSLQSAGTKPDPTTRRPASDEEADATFDTPKGLIEDLKDAGLTYDDFTERYGLPQSTAKDLMQDLREAGYTIDFKEIDGQGTRLYFIPEERDKLFRVGDGDGHYRFGLISDTHLGSKAEHLDELHTYYDRLQNEGVDLVFHAGDISDGWEVHRGHINEIKGEASGWGRLLDYVTEAYPQRQGIDTLFIEGNHDHKYHRRNGVHLGELINDRRDDLHYCGDSQATFVFDQEHDIDLELIHPSGGKPYTAGYRLQTLFRERPSEERPTIAGVGHLHGSMYAQTEGVMGLYTGCWKGLTTWGKRKGHQACIGGWIIDMEIVDGTVRSFTPNWIGFEADDGTRNFSMQDVADMIGRDV